MRGIRLSYLILLILLLPVAFAELNVTIDKSAPRTIYNVSEVISFTVNINNTGSSNYTGINITDYYNTSFLKFLNSSVQPTTVDEVNGVLSWINVSNFFLNETNTSSSFQLNFSARDNISLTRNAINATVQNETLDAALTNSSTFDLQISEFILNQTPVKENLTAGDVTGLVAQFRLIINNTGTTNFSTVNLTDTFNASVLQFATANVTPNTFDNAAGLLSWVNISANFSNANLTPGQAYVILVNFTVRLNRSTTNRIDTFAIDETGNTSTSDANDTILANAPVPSVSVDKTLLTVNPANKSTLVQFRINVSNSGTTNFTSINLTDIFNGSALGFLAANLTPNTASNDTGTLFWVNLSSNLSANGLLQPTQSFEIVLNFTSINASPVPTVNNATALTALDQFSNPANASDLASVTIAGTPNATINKTRMTPFLVNVTQLVRFVITINNSGETNLTNVTLNDTFDGSLIGFFSANATFDVASNVSDNVHFPNILTTPLVPGGSFSIELNFTAVNTTVGEVNNVTTNTIITQNIIDANGNTVATLTSTDIVQIHHQPNLTVTKTLLTPNPINRTQLVRFLVVLNNTGQTNITTLPLNDTFNASALSFVAANISPSTTAAGEVLYLNLANVTPLVPGQAIHIEFNFTALQPGQTTNNATTHNIIDFNNNALAPSSRGDLESLNITDQPNASLSKVLISLSPINISGVVSFMVNITNNGETNITSLTLLDTFDKSSLQFALSNVTANSSSNITGQINYTNLTSNFGSIRPNTTILIQLNFTAIGTTENATNNATITNIVDVNGNNVAQQTASTGVEVQGAANLTVSKNVTSLARVNVSQTVTFLVTINNTGQTNITSLTLNDTFDGNYLLFEVSNVTATTSSNSTGQINFVNLTSARALAPNQSIQIQLNFTARESTVNLTNNLTFNRANVTFALDEAGNAVIGLPLLSSASVRIDHQANLTVTKTLLTPNPVNRTQLVRFLVVLNNTGETNITVLPLNETFNASALQFVAANISPSTTLTGEIRYLNLANVSVLAPGQVIQLELNFSALQPGLTTNNATTHTLTDMNDNNLISPSSRGDLELLNITDQPNASLSKVVVSVTPTNISNQVVFVVNITNTGETNITSLTMLDTFDKSSLQFDTTNVTANSSSNVTGQINYTNLTSNFGSIIPNRTILIQLNFTAIGVTDNATNNVTITNIIDLNGNTVASSNASASLDINGQPNLTVTKTLLSPSPVNISGFVRFLVTINNTGSTNITTLSLNDTFNASALQFLAANISPSTTLTGEIRYLNLTNVSALAAGGIIQIEFNFSALTESSNTINNATIHSLTDQNGNTLTVPSSRGDLEALNITQNSTCGTLTVSTILLNNVSSSGTCFDILGDNIVLDCAGNSITYDNGAFTSNSRGISAINRTNVTIKNCRIVHGQTTQGGASIYGIHFERTNGSSILNNSFEANASDYMINVITSETANISYNTLLGGVAGSGHRSMGIILGDPAFSDSTKASSDSSVIGNVITTKNSAIYTVDGSNNTYLSNTLSVNSSSGDAAMRLSSSTESNIINSTITITAGTGHGLLFSSSNNINISNSSITNPGSGDGISATQSSTIVIKGLTISSNSGRGISFATTSSLLQIIDTAVNSTTGNAIHLDGANVDPTAAITILRSNATSNNGAGSGIVMKSVNASSIIDSRAISTGNGRGINITGSNSVTIDLALARSNFTSAILISSSNKTSIKNTYTNSTDSGSGFGVFASFSFETNISNSTAFGNGALVMEDSSYGYITRNNATGRNGGDGIALRPNGNGANSFSVSDNIAVSDSGSGITVSGSNNSLAFNLARSTDSAAITISTGSGNNLSNNSAISTNERALDLAGATYNNILVNNTASSALSAAFTILGSSVNNRIQGSILRSNSSWILTDSGSTGNNITDTLFDAVNGSIRTISPVALPGDVNITPKELNVSFNRALLNSSHNNHSFLNTSSQITLRGLGFTNAQAMVDLEDDGSFATCNAPRCINVNYTGGTFVFNVSSFSSYQAAEASVANLSVSEVLVTVSPVNISGKVVFNVNITNNGQTNITSLTVLDSFDKSSLHFDSANITATASSNLTGQVNYTNLTSIIGPIIPNQTVLLQLNFTAIGVTDNATNNVTITNIVDLNGNAVASSNATASVDINGLPNATVSNVLVSVSPINVSGKVSFLITVSNNGTTNITSLTILDTFDKSSLQFDITNMTPTSSSNITGQINYTNLTTITGPLIPNQTVTIYLNFTAIGIADNATNNVTITNIVDLNNNPVPSSTASTGVEVQGAANLSITKQLTSLNGTNVSQLVQFLITINNSGQSDLETITLNDRFDGSYLGFIGANVSPSSSDNNTGQISFANLTSAALLAVNQSIQIQLNFTARASTVNNSDNVTTNLANVTLALDEFGNAVINAPFAISTVRINNQPNVTLSKTRVTASPANVSSTIIFEVNVTNTGSTNLTSIPLSDTFNGSAMGFVAANVSVAAASNATGTVTIANLLGASEQLAPGATRTVRLNFSAIAPATNTLNNASAGNVTDFNGYNPANSSSGDVVNITGIINISVAKSLESENPTNVSLTVRYLINVTNTGQHNLTTVALSDTFNASAIKFIAANVSVTSASNATGTLFIANALSQALLPNASVVVALNFTAFNTSTVNNNSISINAQDLNGNNITALASATAPNITLATNVTNLTITKIAMTAYENISENISFLITINNSGNQPVSGILINDSVSADYLEFARSNVTVSTNSSSGVVINNALSGLANISPSSIFVLNLTFTTRRNITNLTNTVTVTITDVNGGNATTTARHNITIIAMNATSTAFSGNSTNFNNASDITNVSNATVDSGNATILWDDPINANGAMLDGNILLGSGFVFLNTSGLNPSFNRTATVTIKGVSCPVSVISFADGDFDTIDEIQQNGRDCEVAGVCSNKVCSGGVLTFTVSHFSGFAAGANTNLTIDSTSPQAQNSIITFNASYVNGSGSPITNASCNLSFPNSTVTPMVNTSTTYELNATFATAGTFNYNVTCSVAGFTTLTAVDSFTISSPVGSSSSSGGGGGGGGRGGGRARAACQDGMDNDGDTKIDLFDPGCRTSTDSDETDEPILGTNITPSPLSPIPPARRDSTPPPIPETSAQNPEPLPSIPSIVQETQQEPSTPTSLTGAYLTESSDIITGVSILASIAVLGIVGYAAFSHSRKRSFKRPRKH